MDDKKIIELFFERSEQAIVELQSKYGRILKKLAFNILGSDGDAEECLNDAYLAVWNTIPPERPDVLSSYVCRIARNIAINRYRMNTATKRNGTYSVALDEIEQIIPSPSRIEDELDEKELSDAINGFLGTLDKESRVMFVRRYWHCDPIEDIAALFHTSRHAVSVKLFRIRKKLRDYLIKKGVSL